MLCILNHTSLPSPRITYTEPLDATYENRDFRFSRWTVWWQSYGMLWEPEISPVSILSSHLYLHLPIKYYQTPVCILILATHMGFVNNRRGLVRNFLHSSISRTKYTASFSGRHRPSSLASQSLIYYIQFLSYFTLFVLNFFSFCLSPSLFRSNKFPSFSWYKIRAE
jgi:hypothetical protein